MTPRARFLKHVEHDRHGCWLWTGARFNGNGYGMFRADSTPSRPPVAAHRFAYVEFVGPIPTGMLVLHKCDVKHCVNPDHLEIGTHSKNTRDAILRGRFFPGLYRKNRRTTEVA